MNNLENNMLFDKIFDKISENTKHDSKNKIIARSREGVDYSTLFGIVINIIFTIFLNITSNYISNYLSKKSSTFPDSKKELFDFIESTIKNESNITVLIHQKKDETIYKISKTLTEYEINSDNSEEYFNIVYHYIQNRNNDIINNS